MNKIVYTLLVFASLVISCEKADINPNLEKNRNPIDISSTIEDDSEDSYGTSSMTDNFTDYSNIVDPFESEEENVSTDKD